MNADDHIKTILAKYGEDFSAETWLVPGGKARAIKHKCIERMAVRAGIKFLRPIIIDASPDNVVLVVAGLMDDQEEWSFGECSPKNNKNQYPYAMAEKRGKDRVALKLIGLHGLLYSEEEAEDFKAPTETAPPPPVTYDQIEEVFTNSLTLDGLKRAAAKFAPDIANLYQQERDNLTRVYKFKAEALKKFGEAA
jgi:hypothetical protein